MRSPDAREVSEESLQLLRRQAHRLRHQMELPWIRIAQIVLHETPADLGLGHALWSRAAVQQAIELKFGVKMPISTVGEYLRRWGCTPQRPVQRAQEQDDAALQRWLEEVYPALHRRAQAEGAEIHWADETAVRQDTAWVRGFAPAGHTPELRHRVNWSHLTMISALSNQGQVRFALHDGSINAERFIEFLQQLIGEVPGRKLFLIVDNLRVHHARKVQDWLAEPEHRTRIELFYLPPYSPEHNPDEWINRDLKTHLRQAAPIKQQSMLRTLAEQFMTKLAQSRELVKNYFEHTYTRYAAAGCGI